MIGNYCRAYRISKNKTLKDVEQGDNIKALSAFEMGRSSNIAHFMKYLKLAIQLNETEKFLTNLAKQKEVNK